MALSPMIMGIINVTPDSFFPGSRVGATDDAVARGREQFDAGCDIVDIGGESTRPGATPVDVKEELRRVIPVIEALSVYGPVSIDTQKSAVARAAIEAGATVLNDVTAEMVELAGEFGVGYVGMHSQGDSTVMQLHPHYDDVVGEIAEFLDEVAQRAVRAGVSRLWLDPGIGFGKTILHNLALLAHVDRFVTLADRYHAGVLI
ncbi:MAG: dihydropteroate synthase, partial [Acidimicrobiales bacterium]